MNIEHLLSMFQFGGGNAQAIGGTTQLDDADITDLFTVTLTGTCWV